MKPVLSTEEVVRLEDIIEREGTSKAELMELAGEFAANEVLKLNPDRVLVLVGFGNNGGDGWVAADILSHKGVDVDIVSPVEPDEIPAALARHVARRTAGRDVHVCVGPSRDELEVLIDKADVVVDAIFGTGFHGNLRAPFSIWIPTVNECADCVVSIDVPSGLNAETGVVDDDCIRAERTVTMIAPKIGLYSADGPEYAGDLICGNLYDRLDEVIDDVDHAAEIVEPGDLVDYFAPLPSNIDKYSRGSVLIVAGSAQYPGAAIMAAKSAARAGAGYVAVAAPDACANLIRMALPSIPVFAIPSDSRGSFGAAARMTVCEIAKKYSCVLCGPGMTTSAGAMQVVSGLLELDVPLILDADALNCLAKIAIDGIDSNPEMYRREQPLVMTPHYRELSRLVAGDEVNDLGTAIAAAQKVVWAAGSDNLVVIAKGPTTAICGVERVLLPLSGPASLATAGSGDVLAGILAGVVDTLAQQVLTETALLALQEVAEGLQSTVVGTGDGTAAAAIVDQSVHSLLQHPLLVADDDVGGVQVHQALQAVVAVDDPAVQVIQVRGGEAAAVQLHHGAQVGRQNGQNVHDHPLRLVAGDPESVHHFQPLDDPGLLLAGGILQLCVELGGEGLQVHVLEQLLHGFGAHAGLEVVLILLTVIPVLLLGEDLILGQRSLTGVGDDIVGEIQHLFQDPGADVQQQAHPGGDALEIPDVGNGGGQLDVAHALPADLGPGDFDAAAVADLALVADLLVLAAVALPILGRPEDTLAVQAVLFGLQSAVVDGLRLLHLAVRPLPDLLRGSHADLNRVKGKLVAVIGFDHVALSSFNDSNDPVLW